MARQPTLYELSGDGIQVTYATSSFAGPPIFNYHDATIARKFTGDEIKKVETPIGTLVTVLIHLTVDSGSTTFSLLVPQVNLPPTNIAQITTEGITTLHRMQIVGPPNGQTELYTTHVLRGTAVFAEF
jgi:hypothetical protein